MAIKTFTELQLWAKDSLNLKPSLTGDPILSSDMIRKAVQALKEATPLRDPDHIAENGDYIYYTNYADAGNFYHKPIILDQPQLTFDPDKALKEEFNRIDQEIKRNWGK